MTEGSLSVSGSLASLSQCLQSVCNAQWETALGIGGHQIEKPLQSLKLIIIAY